MPKSQAREREFENRDATRRTYLATERTQLAWWRTGLTALAVALAVGRVVPELQGSSTQWPYSAAGVGFAAYGLLLIAYGTLRAREVDHAIQRGEWAPTSPGMIALLTVAGIALSLVTAIVIVAY